MTVWGVSRSDVTNSGWNTVVGLGVLAGCAVAAFAVKKIAEAGFAALNKNSSYKAPKNDAFYCSCLGAAVGLTAAVAAYKFIPGSHFALITDDSTSKMFKLGAVQAVVGFAIDYFVNREFYTATVVCIGGAVATRFAYPVLAFLGVVGAGLGSGLIPR